MKLTEKQLNRIITESLIKILNEEIEETPQSETYEWCDKAIYVIGANELCKRLVSRLAHHIDWSGVTQTLKEIISIENPLMAEKLGLE